MHVYIPFSIDENTVTSTVAAHMTNSRGEMRQKEYTLEESAQFIPPIIASIYLSGRCNEIRYRVNNHGGQPRGWDPEESFR